VQQLAKQKEHVCFHRNICLINIFFFSVGALLYIYAAKGIEVPTDLVTGKPRTDLLFPEIAFHNTDSICHLLTRIDSGYFCYGLCLNGTNHFLCVDFLGIKPKTGTSPLQ
jgi:hypothetical protein